MINIKDIKTVEDEMDYHVQEGTGVYLNHAGAKKFAVVKGKVKEYQAIEKMFNEEYKRRWKIQNASKLRNKQLDTPEYWEKTIRTPENDVI